MSTGSKFANQQSFLTPVILRYGFFQDEIGWQISYLESHWHKNSRHNHKLLPQLIFLQAHNKNYAQNKNGYGLQSLAIMDVPNPYL